MAVLARGAWLPDSITVGRDPQPFHVTDQPFGQADVIHRTKTPIPTQDSATSTTRISPFSDTGETSRPSGSRTIHPDDSVKAQNLTARDRPNST